MDIKQAQSFAGLISNLPYNYTVKTFMLSQLAHETAGFESNIFKTHNNIGGINWANQTNATKGKTIFENGKNLTYAKFDTVENCFKYWLNLLNKRYAKVFEATTAAEYAKALRDKGYYTDTLTNYTKAIGDWIGTFKKYKVDIPALPTADITELKKKK